MSAKFTFIFVEMGQGDCCMVKCPDGKVVVVDCGSTNVTEVNQEYVIEAQVQLRTWVSSQGNKIAALVLTHSDLDHHNKVVEFFKEDQYMGIVRLPSSGKDLEDPKISHCDIDRIYFSNSAGDGAPLGNYTAGGLYKNEYGLNNNVYAGHFNTNEIHEVTINNAEDKNTTLSAGFTQPALNATVVATVGVTSWLAIGQTVYVSVGGYYSVQKIDDLTHVTLINLGYAGNAAPAATVPSGGTVTPKNYYKTWKYEINKFKTLVSTTNIPNKRLPLFSGNTDGKAWSVSVIAGNVPKGYGGVDDAATAANAKSLITLFEVDGKKALLTGDATFSTEKFLYKIHKDLLTNLDLAQVPHHGSSYASSNLLVNTVNPKAAVTSVGFLEHSYRLPWYEDVLDRWLHAVETRGVNIRVHDLDYWYGKDITDADILAKYNEWTNDGKDFSRVGCNEKRFFWYLQAPANGIYAFYQLVKGGYFLFRETVVSNLCLTSQMTQTYTLSDAGVTYNG